MKEYYTFDDVLIKPKFSTISSRKDVDLSTEISNSCKLTLPIISSNMDTITGDKMSIKMAQLGGMGILHRFWSIRDNMEAFFNISREYINHYNIGVSIGLGDAEKDRFHALYNAGAKVFCIDVANGAQQSVVDQAKFIKDAGAATLIVGNFATLESIEEFNYRAGKGVVDTYKVGIGPGSVCSTRIKTGIGVPQLSAIKEICQNSEFSVIADGGIKNPGDAAKALAAGAKAVMIGSLLAGCEETPGKIVYDSYFPQMDYNEENGEMKLTGTIGLGEKKKIYRGSASIESYQDQNKISEWRTAEGVSILVPYKESIEPIIKDLEAGIRSSLTYTGSKNLQEFRQNAEFIRVSESTRIENSPYKLLDNGSK